MSDGWYYLSSQGHVGPLSLEELKETLAAFQNGKDVLVWREGFANWRRAGNVPEVDAETPLPPSQIDGRRGGAANAKLPLWDTICLSYLTYFGNFPDVLRISWLWLAVATPLMGIANWLRLSWMVGMMADLKRGPSPQIPTHMVSMPVETIALGLAAGLVLMLAGVSIAVAWHRRIILGEYPGFSGSNVVAKNLWRYVAMGLAIGLIVILPALAVVLPMSLLLPSVITGAVPRSAMFVAAITLFSLAAFAVVLRLSLLLPARAVGDLNLTFKEPWKRTRGNTWRIFWGIAACTMLPMLAAQIVFVLFEFPDPSMFASQAFVGRMAVATTIFTVYHLLILPIGIGFLSHSYRHFFERM